MLGGTGLLLGGTGLLLGGTGQYLVVIGPSRDPKGTFLSQTNWGKFY